MTNRHLSKQVLQLIHYDRKELVDTMIDFLNKKEYEMSMIVHGKRVILQFEPFVQNILKQYNEARLDKDVMIQVLENTRESFKKAFDDMVWYIFGVKQYECSVCYDSEQLGDTMIHIATYEFTFWYKTIFHTEGKHQLSFSIQIKPNI